MGFKKNQHPVDTGDAFLEKAREAGAVVKESHDGFYKVTTPKGSMKLAPGTTKLDKRTISNTARWFRLLGIPLVVFLLLLPRILWALGVS